MVETERTPIQVRMLGGFALRMGECEVSDSDNRSRKVWLLLAYLIYNRSRVVPGGELVDLLWGDAERVSDTANSLKTIFHRLRLMLDGLGDGMGAKLVLRREGGHQWNPDARIEVDAERFEALAKAALSAEHREKQVQNGMLALELYTGDFLPKLSTEAWSVPVTAYYHNLYISCLQALLPLLAEAERWQEMVGLCRKGIQVEPYSEGVYIRLMEALLKQGEQRATIQVYEEMRRLLLDNFGVIPSDRAQALYREAASAGNERAVSITTVLEQLREEHSGPGALLCDYGIFKVLAQSEARGMVRRGEAVHVALFSLADEKGGDLPKRVLDRYMEKAVEVVCSCLRKGDAVARCSFSQYAVMLHQSNYENSCMVCKRIVAAYNSRFPRCQARLHFAVSPLEPNQ